MPLSDYLLSAESMAADRAASRVRAMQDHITQSVGIEVRWTDEGDVAFAKTTDMRVLHGLRSLAAWNEYPPRTLLLFRRPFRLLDDPRDHPSLRRIYSGDDTAFPHLMRHSDNRGFWFPADFPEPAECNEEQWWRIGSLPGLDRELARLGPMVAALPAGADRQYLEEGLAFLRKAVEAALGAGLPLIIEGT